MQRSRHFTLKHCLAALALAPLLSAAAELGDLTVSSFVGQPLQADIELVALTAQDLAGLEVRLASSDVYRGASITMNPALQTLKLAVVRRDQRQFLHLASVKPIEADYLHLFLVLDAGARSDVRAVTVWLTANPHPAPSAVAIAPPPPAPASVPVATPAPRVETAPAVATQLTLAPMAAPSAPVAAEPRVAASATRVAENPVAIAKTAAAALGSAPAAVSGSAAVAASSAATVSPVLPAAKPVASSAKIEPADAPEASLAHLVSVASEKLSSLLPQRQASTSCSPASTGAQAAMCQRDERKHSVISRKLAELEEKLRVLQGAMHSSDVFPAEVHQAAPSATPLEQDPHAAPAAVASSVASAAVAVPAVHSAPPKPVVKHAPVPLKAKTKKEAGADKKPGSSTSLVAVAGGVAGVLAVGALAAYLLRRRKPGQVASAPSQFRVLLGNPFRRRRRQLDHAPVTETPAGDQPATELDKSAE